MHTSREAWERSWAEDLDKNFNPRNGLFARRSNVVNLFTQDVATLTSDEVLLYLDQEARLICKLQEDLVLRGVRQQAGRASDAIKRKNLSIARVERLGILLN